MTFRLEENEEFVSFVDLRQMYHKSRITVLLKRDEEIVIREFSYLCPMEHKDFSNKSNWDEKESHVFGLTDSLRSILFSPTKPIKVCRVQRWDENRNKVTGLLIQTESTIWLQDLTSDENGEVPEASQIVTEPSKIKLEIHRGLKDVFFYA